MTPSLSTLTLTVHDPTQLSLEERLEVGAFSVQCALADVPADPPFPAQAIAAELGHRQEDEEHRLLLARVGSVLVGKASVFYSLSQNTDKAHLGVTVHPQHRRRGLGRALARRAAELALELGRRTYTAGSSSRVPAGEGFLTALGAQAALPMLISELRLDALDPARLAAWVTRPQGDAYALHRFTRIPEHELGRVAAVMQVMNTAPRGELEFDDWVVTPAMVANWQQLVDASGEVRLLYAVEHVPTQELVGYTETFWHPQRAGLAFQGATGVRPDHRGQGLGKWLKAAMAQDLPVAFPGATRVRTGNADVNAAMLGINRALGFQPAFRTTEWQGQVRDVLAATGAARQPLPL